MVVAFTGRRSPALGDESVVRERLHAYLTRSGPTAVVGAAACGADLLVLEEALRLKIDPQVVLPTPLARFRAESVEPGWRDRFDTVLATTGHTEATPDAAGEDPFTAGNEAILRAALAADQDVVALIVAAPGESEYTEGFARSADALGVPVTRLDELGLRFEARNSAFPRPG